MTHLVLFNLLLVIVGLPLTVGIPAAIASISWPDVLFEMLGPRPTRTAVTWC